MRRADRDDVQYTMPLLQVPSSALGPSGWSMVMHSMSGARIPSHESSVMDWRSWPWRRQGYRILLLFAETIKLLLTLATDMTSMIPLLTLNDMMTLSTTTPSIPRTKNQELRTKDQEPRIKNKSRLYDIIISLVIVFKRQCLLYTVPTAWSFIANGDAQTRQPLSRSQSDGKSLVMILIRATF